MNSAEQTVTWLITLGVLESPKKNISDPEAFLQTSLKDGVVLCRLLERLSPGSTGKVRAELPFVFPSSARLCRRERDMTRFVTSLFFANWSMKRLFCRSRERGLLSLKTVPNGGTYVSILTCVIGYRTYIQTDRANRSLWPMLVTIYSVRK